LFYLGAFGNIGLMIALPIALGAIIGSYFDGKFGTKQVMRLSELLLIIISIAGFIQLVRRILRGEYNPK
jgi:MFS-type transporter involved in bile tolerance (Atg22 family)